MLSVWHEHCYDSKQKSRKVFVQICYAESIVILQIRYFNPKTRQFYYHGIHPTMPPDGSSQQPAKNLILAGEPETFSDYAHPYHMVRA